MSDNFTWLVRKSRALHVEGIIEILFKKSGYIVQPFAYERTMPLLAQDRYACGKRSAIFSRIATMPDMLVFRPGEGLIAVEVKYREQIHSQLSKDVQRTLRYWPGTHFVILCPPSNGRCLFVCMPPDYFNKDGSVDLTPMRETALLFPFSTFLEKVEDALCEILDGKKQSQGQLFVLEELAKYSQTQ